jgi:aspartate/methionine/tyrosine aminotransferase
LVEIDLSAVGHEDATAYCHQLVRDTGVLLLPGDCLGCQSPFVRFGFGRQGFPEAIGAYEAVLHNSI